MRVDEAIISYDFIKNEDEPCVYKKISGSSITFLVIYVDDIRLIENDVGILSLVKACLSKNFSMKDLGEATYLLGIRICRDRSRRLLGLLSRHLQEKNVWEHSPTRNKKKMLRINYGAL